MKMRVAVCVLAAVLAVTAGAVSGEDDPLDPDVQHGTITRDGRDIDFWKTTDPMPPPMGNANPVPEPATLSLLAAGSFMLIRRRRR